MENMSNLYIPVCGFFCAILVLICYFTKKRINTKETSIYSGMIIVSFIDCLLMISIIGISYIDSSQIALLEILNKLDYLQFLVWVWLFFGYVFHITYKDKEKIYKYYDKIMKYSGIFNILCGVVIGLLNVNIFIENNVMYSYGSSANFLYTICALYIALVMITLLINIKKIFTKKYIPFFVFILLAIVVLILRNINPGLVIITAVLAYIDLIMYFTIENPDVRLMEEINIAKDNAEKANAAKTDFLSSMSHEIRTPLNAIVGFSEAINEENDLESAKNDAKDIVLAANNLLEIVNGILDISKIEANKMEIVEKDYNPTELFESIAKLTAPRIGEKPIELEVNIAKDLPSTLYGDSGKLKQITTNILTNAVKYTEKGKITYTVSCVNLKNESSLVISVEDTGRGIKPEQIDKLFTKFQRLEEDRNTTLEGTGLGLAITKRLVEMMGGKIVVQSVYGSGSKFTIYIKQKINHRLQSENFNKKDDKPLIKDFTGKKVLVVDDNKLNLKVARRLLTNYNLEIIDANSGFECIDKINNHERFDLILMDDMMPKMTGSETLERLKKDSSFKIPVVILTANAIEGMKNKYLDKGFDDYLAKPIEKDELERVLNRFLNRPIIEEKEPTRIEIVQTKVEIIDSENETRKIIEETKVEGLTTEELNKAKEATEVDDTNMNTNTKEYLESQGIDVNHGLELLGDMDMYNSIMEDFITEMEERLPKLEEYKNNEDMPNYAVLVHAIKSDCKYLGIMDLADHNYEHELKSKASDVDFVKADYDKLIEHINKYLEVCKKYSNK